MKCKHGNRIAFAAPPPQHKIFMTGLDKPWAEKGAIGKDGEEMLVSILWTISVCKENKDIFVPQSLNSQVDMLIA